MAAKTRQLAPRTVAAIDSLESMWAEVAKHRESILTERPPICFTVAEFAEKFGLHNYTAERQIKAMVKSGVLTAERCFLLAADGSKRATNIFIPKAGQ